MAPNFAARVNENATHQLTVELTGKTGTQQVNTVSRNAKTPPSENYLPSATETTIKHDTDWPCLSYITAAAWCRSCTSAVEQAEHRGVETKMVFKITPIFI